VDIVDFAKKNNIKVAVNPSKQQLSLPEEQLKNIFKKVDILFLNQEEASFLTKIPFEEEQNIFKKIDEICPGIAVMTRGGEGTVASDGKYLYSALPDPDRKIVDTTGAGDSFASGFLTDYIKYNGDIEKAIQLGLANSAANLSEVGAKTGLLDKNSKFNRVKVLKEECGKNNLCITK
jgi:sugar/nucleoside kinase (ribokinase family)